MNIISLSKEKNMRKKNKKLEIDLRDNRSGLEYE